MPEDFYTLDPTLALFNNTLKSWVNINVFKDGDSVFKGKIPESLGNHDENDWLVEEVKTWQRQQEHEQQSREEIEDIDPWIAMMMS